ncbi:MAG: hypothetical protein A2301_02430 [Candidatus Magasanikbacteria bacterium RIFOXYB2_FULL_40_13]|uniref:PsbP C-terminal domain-containing protein n=2 Tax=Candidatus Magasanikiibacteriota TaxID=1752731 RepID=A0A1F6NJH0_9BACT|nr:MAG: hypothetical protein A2224_00120 [Candidatus Magasanikbacteria bacterium RIFOXYA2_FULL_40_20]OGH84117.1 MAG: hypothetical protein A2373_02640 [Candidatus Magasanikbacteria bacterium RIFOXYB1_FULL_40_15]OGH86544.1 MAG: hypothetical protein A2301_02430 [Candidatus Magasanikbacteria bacterium RIFOXYB2_FULL_40_13]OGH87935.1 MAG: hypothetical protein A2206_03500 [Candidatus Magasanikbacteria bacterium RIFOXYA1_FULL_40_8]
MKKQNSIISIFSLIILVLLAIVVASLFVFFKTKPEQKAVNLNNIQKTENVEVDEKKQIGVVIEGSKYNTYRNEEFGFEFEFPKDWEVREAFFKNYYSIFNIVLKPKTGQTVFFPILINVVLPKFADNAFKHDTVVDNATIDGINGIVYKYEEDGIKKASYVFSLGENKIILGSDLGEVEVFNEFVKSFKFLK